MRARLLAACAGVALALLLLEGGLRILTWSSSAAQRWSEGAKPSAAYRILCLGESTTYLQYPEPLEAILNERGQGRRFVVFDGGVPAINTNYVVAHLAENLDRYKPDMVVAMIGNNDVGVAYLRCVHGKGSWPYSHSQAFRLAAMLWRQAALRWNQGRIPALPAPRRDARTPPPTGPELHLRQAMRLLDLGRPRAAAALVHLACREKPGEPQAWLQAARLELARGKPAPARRCLARAEAAGAGRADLLAAWGRFHAAARDWAAARTAFEGALVERPGDLPARQGLADLLREQGDDPEAEQALLAMAKESPQDPARWGALGRFYCRAGRYNEAAAALQRALRLDPDRPQDWDLLAQSFRMGGRPVRAETVYRRMQKGWPALFSDSAGLSVAIEDQGQESDGAGDVPEYILHEQHKIQPLFILAARRGAQKEQEADLIEAWARQAVDKEPWNPAGHRDLGVILTLHDRPRYREAERELRLASALNPDDAYARLILARLFHRQHRWGEAEKLYREALASRPKDRSTLLGLALVCDRTHRRKLAALLRRQAAEVEGPPSRTMTRDNFLRIKAMLDQRGTALVAVQYPMRSVEALQRTLAGDEKGVSFVDNERTFYDAVAREGYAALFVDNFAGDFGHCTAKGNRLLASDIADVVLARLSGR